MTDGLESALAQAKAAAGDRDVSVAGGANIIQQCMKAGLLDQIQIHLVPVLLGEGRRLFDHLGPDVEMDSTRVIESPGVTHSKYRVVKEHEQEQLTCAHDTPRHDRYCDEVITETDLLRQLLTGATLSVTVPTCPDWTLADLVRHIGGNLRSVETAVRARGTVQDSDDQVAQAAAPDGDDPAVLDRWLAEAAARFADTLREAGPEAETRVFGFRGSTAFWARRAAHDIVIHRADAAITVGADYTVASEVAADAIDELLELISDPQVADSSPRLAELRGLGKSIHLHATETAAELAAEWLIELGADGFTWRRGHERATVALRGPLADVLRVFYRRLPANSEQVEVLGEAALLDFWLERVSLG